MGLIRRSDIFLSIDRETRSLINQIAEELGADSFHAIGRKVGDLGVDVDPEEIKIYLDLHRDRAFIGDLYVFITGVEKSLHGLIEDILRSEYGDNEDGWWREGIPQSVRLDCVKAREIDQDTPAPPYCYTTFIHLKVILDKKWALFTKYLPPDVAADKPDLMGALNRINTIRNKVMHPVRESPPTEDEFEFVREMRRKLAANRWRYPK
jgi:hypothetical protein